MRGFQGRWPLIDSDEPRRRSREGWILVIRLPRLLSLRARLPDTEAFCCFVCRDNELKVNYRCNCAHRGVVTVLSRSLNGTRKFAEGLPLFSRYACTTDPTFQRIEPCLSREEFPPERVTATDRNYESLLTVDRYHPSRHCFDQKRNKQWNRSSKQRR